MVPALKTAIFIAGAAVLAACGSSGGTRTQASDSPPAAVSTPADDSSTPTPAAPSTSTPPAFGAPRTSNFIATCTSSDNASLALDFYDAKSGERISSQPNLTYQADNFRPFGAGSLTCDGLSFNGDLTHVAGYDTANGVPATMTLSDGTVTDKETPPPTGGFDAQAPSGIFGETYNPTNNDFWYVKEIANDGTTDTVSLIGPAVTRTYKFDSDPGTTTPSDGNGDVQFFWPKNGSVPYVDLGNELLHPNGKVDYGWPYGQPPDDARPTILDKSKLPTTDDGIGDIIYSDDATSAAFVAETPAPDNICKLYTVSGKGGEPTQVGPDLDWRPSAGVGPGASPPQVIRYVTTTAVHHG